MNKFQLALFVLPLAACANAPGTGRNVELDADYDLCQSAALLVYPVKEVQRTAYVTSGYQYSMTTRPEIVDIDLNKNKRTNTINQCMYRKGWTSAPFVGWHKQ